MMKLSFPVTDNNTSAVAEQDGKPVFFCRIGEGTLVCEVFYDFDVRPLTLKASVKERDNVELIFLPYRIELWVNGMLMDEEWPAGNCMFTGEQEIRTDLQIKAEPYAPVKKTFPSVLGTFENAEDWRPEGNIFVGDCMPYVHDGRYHVLYLKDRRHHGSKWFFGAHQWEHISTDDFVHWEIHPTAVEITAPHEGSICTGSWICKGDTQYLFYTVRMADRSPAPVSRSISKDGCRFEKDPSFGFTLPVIYDAASARDPKVIFGEDGLYHMFLTTSLLQEGKGCLAHLVSRDPDTWEDTGIPMYICEDDTQPECPDYIRYGENYYLIFSLHGKAYYRYSEKPFDGWKTPKEPAVPCHNVPKGAVWGNEIVFAGYKPTHGGYAGTMSFVSAVQDENGELCFTRKVQSM